MNRLALWTVLATVASGCSSAPSPRESGGEGQACYPNNTCNVGLVCVQGVCKAGLFDAAAADGGGPDGFQPQPPDASPDGSQPQPPDASPAGCTPDEPFCRDGNIRRCADDGKTSVLLTDCADRYSAAYQCAECPDAKLVCQAPSLTTNVKSTGLLSFDVLAYPGACEGDPSASATFNFASAGGIKLFTFSVYPTSGDQSASCGQNYEMVSGQTYALRQNPMVLGITYRTGSGTVCISNYSGPSIVEPPNPGTVTVTYAGKDIGDMFSIAASGYLTCDFGKTWAPFSLVANGPLTR